MKVWVLMGYTLGKYDPPDVIGVYREYSTMLYDVSGFLTDTYFWTPEEVTQCLPTDPPNSPIYWEDKDGDQIAWAWLEEVQ